MIGLDTIRITKPKDSNLDLSRVKKFVEEKLKTPKGSRICVGWYNQEMEEVKILLRTPISIERMYKILNDFHAEKIKIKEFVWRENKNGIIGRGTFDIIVS